MLFAFDDPSLKIFVCLCAVPLTAGIEWAMTVNLIADIDYTVMQVGLVDGDGDLPDCFIENALWAGNRQVMLSTYPGSSSRFWHIATDVTQATNAIRLQRRSDGKYVARYNKDGNTAGPWKPIGTDVAVDCQKLQFVFL